MNELAKKEVFVHVYYYILSTVTNCLLYYFTKAQVNQGVQLTDYMSLRDLSDLGIGLINESSLSLEDKAEVVEILKHFDSEFSSFCSFTTEQADEEIASFLVNMKLLNALLTTKGDDTKAGILMTQAVDFKSPFLHRIVMGFLLLLCWTKYKHGVPELTGHIQTISKNFQDPVLMDVYLNFFKTNYAHWRFLFALLLKYASKVEV